MGSRARREGPRCGLAGQRDVPKKGRTGVLKANSSQKPHLVEGGEGTKGTLIARESLGGVLAFSTAKKKMQSCSPVLMVKALSLQSTGGSRKDTSAILLSRQGKEGSLGIGGGEGPVINTKKKAYLHKRGHVRTGIAHQ